MQTQPKQSAAPFTHALFLGTFLEVTWECCLCEHKRFRFFCPGFTRPALHVLGMTWGRKGALFSCNMNVQRDTEMALKSATHQSSHISLLWLIRAKLPHIRKVHRVHGHMLIKIDVVFFFKHRDLI